MDHAKGRPTVSTMDEPVEFVQICGNECTLVGTMTRKQAHGAVNWWQENGDPNEPTQIEINGRCYRMRTSFFGSESSVVVEPLGADHRATVETL